MLNISELVKKPMMQNFVSLVLLQGINYLLPLLTFPFLFRVLGVEHWGLITFGYTLIQYFVIFTDFGFNLSATKYISTHRDSLHHINRYLNSAFICRFLLAATGFLFLLLLTMLFDKFKQESLFFISYFGIVIGNVMFPMWYFQGMEKMKYITVFNIVAKSVSFIPFFIFIREPQDYALVPVFYSIGFILAGLISIYIIYFKEKMKWFIPSLKEIRFAFSDSFTYFLSRLSVSMFTNINTFIIGLVCGNTAVGYYSAAEKLYQAYNQLLIPFSGVLFPHIAKTRDVSFFKRTLRYITPANIILLTGILLYSSWIIQIVYGGSAQEGSLLVFRILMCGCFFTIPSMLLGYPFLAAMGHAHYTNWTVVIVSVFHIAGLSLFFALGVLSVYSVAALVVCSESLLFVFRIRGVKKYKLIS
ncbi:MAG: oligosaccharide flippase family protein [Tannerellaceae bacterium]|jgi:PST family polysaccharide transporter|nr:oligosaccharide flippase family protein [Tannerellaceae bacterium]